MVVALYSKQRVYVFLHYFSLPVLRSCITSGEQWDASIQQVGVVSVASGINNLGTELENLPFVLGLWYV